MKKFKENNPAIKISTETEHVNIEGLWNDATFMCRFSKSEDISKLNDIILPEALSAIIDLKENHVEYIFAPLHEKDALIGRKYEFNYNSETFELSFETPSKTLELLAKGFRPNEDASDTRYRNLRLFKDFYRDDKTPGMERFFKNRVPVSYVVRGNLDLITDQLDFAKTVNFYNRYYDRNSPSILIFSENNPDEDFVEYCHNEANGFPKHINSVNVEPVILDLFQIASETKNVRLKYIFYYQVLEYCSYYYLNEGLQRKLNNLVKNPDIINNSNHYSKVLVEEFKNYFKANDDKQKMEKLVCDHVSYHELANEIIMNHDYFSKDIVFDGGFKISALINNENEAKNPHKDILKSIIDRIDKIRNVLVHIRESRENKVILPTKRNNHLLVPYLFLTRRLAEIVAIKYN
jgi:hypothetical protein